MKTLSIEVKEKVNPFKDENKRLLSMLLFERVCVVIIMTFTIERSTTMEATAMVDCRYVL